MMHSPNIGILSFSERNAMHTINRVTRSLQMYTESSRPFAVVRRLEKRVESLPTARTTAADADVADAQLST